jgi:drug/metabolite transporter (DMT)-like permease
MPVKIKFILALAIFLWASAFVGIRVGLQGYSPEGLALLRYLIASTVMAIFYFRLPAVNRMPLKDIVTLLGVGMIGIGVYNITLNHGELELPAGTACFITSQSPLIAAIFALIFLNEQLNFLRIVGFLVSILGVSLIAFGEKGGFKWDASMTAIIIATLAGGSYTIMQKPFLKKYHAIQATTLAIWGGTLFLLLYTPNLKHDLQTASFNATVAVIYLGIFPAAIGYLAWSYVLSEIPAARAVSYLYFLPFVATFVGWLLLGEVPVWLSLAGGCLSIVGVWLINESYRIKLRAPAESQVN